MTVVATSLGTQQSSSTASTLTLTTSAITVVPGDVFVIGVTCDVGSAQTISSIGGTLPVTWTKIDDQIDAGGTSRLATYIGVATGFVVAATKTILVTFSATTTNRGCQATMITGASGIVAAHAINNTSATASATCTLGTASDIDSGIGIAISYTVGTARTGTPDTGWTEIAEAVVGTTKQMQTSTKVYTSGMKAFTGPYTETLAASGTQNTVALLMIPDYGEMLLAYGFESDQPLTETGVAATTTGGTAAHSTTQKKTGGSSLRVNRTSNADVCATNPTMVNFRSRITGSFWMYVATLPSANVNIIDWTDSASEGVSFFLSPAGFLTSQAYDSTNAVSTTSATIATLSTGTWYLIEYTGDVSGTQVTMTARVNGGSTVTTQATGAVGGTSFGTFHLGTSITGQIGTPGASTYDIYFDDFTVFSGTGFVGDLRCNYVVPDGTATDLDTNWTITGGGANRMAAVNEMSGGATAADDAVTMISSSTASQIQRLEMNTATVPTLCRGVYVIARLGSTATTAVTVAVTLQNGSAVDHASSYTFPAAINGWTAGANAAFSQPPNGLPKWTQSEINAMRVKLTHSTGTALARVTAVGAYVVTDATTSTPQTISPTSTGVAFAGTGAIRSVPTVAGSSGVGFGGSGSIAGPGVVSGSAGASFAGTSTLSAPTTITPATSGASFSGTGAIRVPMTISPAAANAGFAGTGAVTANSLVAPAAAGAAFAGTGAITAPTSLSATGNAAFAGSGAIRVPMTIAPAASGVGFSGTGAISASGAAAITPAASGVSFGGAGAILAISLISGNGATSFAGAGAITAPTSLAGTSGVGFAGSSSLSAPTKVTFASSGASFSATGSITAPTSLSSSAGVAFGQSGFITVPGSAVINAQASGVAFGGAGSITSIPRVAGTGSTSFAGTGTVNAPQIITFSPGTAGFAGTGSVRAPATYSGSGGASFAGTASLRAPALLGGAGATSFAGIGGITAVGTSTITPGVANIGFSGSFVLQTVPKYGGSSGVTFTGTMTGFGFPVIGWQAAEYARMRLSQQLVQLRRQYLIRQYMLLHGSSAAYLTLLGNWRPLIPDIPRPDDEFLDDTQEWVARMQLRPNSAARNQLQANWQSLVPDGPAAYDDDQMGPDYSETLGNL